MKKLLCFLVVILFAGSVYAQPEFATDGGSMSIGGGISINSSGGDLYEDTDGSRSFSVSINPDFSIFIVPSLSVGVEFLARLYTRGSYSNNSLGLGPSLTYYIAGHKDRRVYPYIGLSYLFYKYSYKDTDIDGYEGDSKETSITGRFGVMFMLSSAVALNMEGNYVTVSSTTGSYDPVLGNQFYFGLGIKSFIF